MVMSPDTFGIVGSNPELTAMKYSFVSVGIWWISCSQYTFYFLPEPFEKKKIIKDIILNGFKELIDVWNELKNILVIKKYLIAFFIYSSALQTVLLIAAYFGEQEIIWPEDEKTIGLIVSILLIQLIAIFGAIFTSKLSEKFGNIYTLIILNLIWAFLCIGAYFITKPIEFYVAAALVGLVMGGIQALSRSTFSKMIPETENTTSYFSFYDVSQKVSIVFGMTLFAFLDQITGSMRSSILVFVIIFLVGAFLLKRIKIKNY
jgi:UMF1 family MFS transporter